MIMRHFWWSNSLFLLSCFSDVFIIICLCIKLRLIDIKYSSTSNYICIRKLVLEYYETMLFVCDEMYIICVVVIR